MLHRRGEPFPEEQVLIWTAQILEVLDYLHTHDPKIIYRDLKPSNIMIDTKNRVNLVDFGIARPHVDESDNTHVVSAGYSPPEQYWGDADTRSDMYALGATMHFLLTGEEPIPLQASSPRNLNPEVSQHANDVVLRATAQDKILRYQTAPDMKADLLSGPQKSARFSQATRDALRWLTVLGVILLCGLVLGTFGSVVRNVTDQNKDTSLKEQQKEAEANRKSKAINEEIDELQQQNQAYRKALTKRTDSVPEAKAAAQADEPKAKKATIAFREVDEAQLTDPDDQLEPLSEPAPSQATSPPAIESPEEPQSESTNTSTDQ